MNCGVGCPMVVEDDEFASQARWGGARSSFLRCVVTRVSGPPLGGWYRAKS